MENQLELLTVATLIRDLKDFDQDAEVCVAMHGIPITLPVGFITMADATYEDGAPKKYVMMIISPISVKHALDFAAKQETDAHQTAETILQLN